jgi:hypothetical protein
VIGILGWDSTFTAGVISVDLETHLQVANTSVEEQFRVNQQLISLNENISAMEGNNVQSRVEINCMVVFDEKTVDLFIMEGGFKNPAMSYTLIIFFESIKTLSEVEIEIQGIRVQFR